MVRKRLSSEQPISLKKLRKRTRMLLQPFTKARIKSSKKSIWMKRMATTTAGRRIIVTMIIMDITLEPSKCKAFNIEFMVF